MTKKPPKKRCGTCKHWNKDGAYKNARGHVSNYSPAECRHPMQEFPIMPWWMKQKVGPITYMGRLNNLVCGSYGTDCETWEKA